MLFPETVEYGYAAARGDFVRLAQAVGLRLRSFAHPDLQGPAGEALAIDVATWWPGNIRTLLVIVSGTHGVEGFAGSVCQRALLQSGACIDPSPCTGLMLVHALNPYGFAYISNENNVDLNRNCLDHFHDSPGNDAYGRLHPVLVPQEWSAEAPSDPELSAVIARIGAAAFQQAVTGGQYHWPQGLFYGGDAPQWSRRVLESVVATAFHGLRKIAIIDLHTGLGSYGDGELIYTGSAADPEYAATKAFFADHTVTCPDAGNSVSAHVSGPLTSAFDRWAEPGALASIALEFGVRDVMTTLNALRGDAWVRQRAEPPPALAQAVRQSLLSAFFSTDPVWLNRVKARFLEVTHAALEGLAR
jgi:hypothetical protein